jgi:type II secretory pathway component GspD/PulD (secretin)
VKQIVGLGQRQDLGEYPTSATGLRLNFREAPLQTVLNYLGDAADLTVQVDTKVQMERAINLWKDELVDKKDALRLLQQVLIEKGYAAIHKGRNLTIIRSQDAKKYYIPLPTLDSRALSA